MTRTNGSNEYAPGRVALAPSGLVTVRSVTPAPWAGVTTSIRAESTTVTELAGTPPKATAAPERNPVPVMTTIAPPRELPEPGVTDETAGAGAAEPTTRAKSPDSVAR